MTILGQGQSQILPFATGTGANVESPTNWASDAVLQQGFQRGIVASQKFNTPLRQATFIASMIAQFMADYSGNPTNDDGQLLNAEQNFTEALQAFLQPFGVYFMLDTGTANNMVGNSTPAPTSYQSPGLIVIKKMAADNTGPMTCNFWNLGSVALTDMVGVALSSGALKSGGLYILAETGGNYRVLGGTSTYTTVTNLTANSGDMITVQVSGEVDWRAFAGTHDTTVGTGDAWPRGKASDGTARYMLTSEFVTWIQGQLSSPLRNIQVFNTSGTYTPTALAKKAMVIITGGGGAGGGGSGFFYSAGSGGGAGATSIALVDLTGVVTVPVTIGAGGSGTFATSSTRPWYLWPYSTIYGDGGDGSLSSFGTYATADGGKGGRGGFYSQSGLGGVGGAPGSSSGNLMVNGGTAGQSTTTWGGILTPFSGNGGSSFWGGGALGASHAWFWFPNWISSNGQNGQDGQAPGSGGGGGGGIQTTYLLSGTAPGRGGNGMHGACMVLEF